MGESEVVLILAPLIDGWMDRMRWHWPRWATAALLLMVNAATLAMAAFSGCPTWLVVMASAVTAIAAWFHESWFNDGGVRHKAQNVPWYRQDPWHWAHWCRLYPSLICILFWGANPYWISIFPAGWAGLAACGALSWRIGKGKWDFSTWLKWRR